MQVTQISYDYTDARGFSASREVYVSGTFTPEQLDAIEESFDGGEFFIPTQVGLPALQHELISFPSKDDHVWHIMEPSDFVVLDALPPGQASVCTAQEFADRFDDIEWDVAGECARLGIDS